MMLSIFVVNALKFAAAIVKMTAIKFFACSTIGGEYEARFTVALPEFKE